MREQRPGEVDPLPAAAAQFDPLHDRDIMAEDSPLAHPFGYDSPFSSEFVIWFQFANTLVPAAPVFVWGVY